MEGVIDDDELRGIIPRAVDRLFESIYDSPEQLQFQLKLSYYEIYCEKYVYSCFHKVYCYV